MNNPRLKSAVLLASIVAVVAGVSLYVVARPSPSPTPSSASLPAASGAIGPVATFAAAATQPKITWSTTSVNVILSPGESTSSNLTFTSNQQLTNISLSVVPQIAPFVTVQPDSFANVPANQAQSVHISFAIPVGAALGTYSGTVHIRLGSRTIPQTPQVTIEIWHSFTDTVHGFTFKYPPAWQLANSQDSIFLYSDTSITGLAGGDVETPPDISIRTLSNSSGLPLIDVINSYEGGWFANYQQVVPETVATHQGIFVSDVAATIPRVPQLGLFIAFGNNVLLVTGHENTQAEFSDITNTISVQGGP